ncbi:queuosine salvage family protein [Thermomicrobium sp. 4228-Ro]|uniref:queuosine 5'-phosphate N-glycosylase/hydrolase n=1 Tax=Thermomicrobium sp. 4228-Ro TaxID=2993937 RepID=UPI0022489980|nr:queuosine salvage family protein [Thermomicrobium sp. 4228-Ro]MCX2726917.1 queuosine salvage family protein [Thermomicrobium sp. 4228-Ro]
MLSAYRTLPDPLGIRAATRIVLERARWVQLDPGGIERILTLLPTPLPDLPDWDHPLHWRGTPEQTANYVLLLDALNFCFWGEPRWRIRYRDQLYDGYWALAAALRRALERGQPLYDARYLAQLTDDQIADLFAGEGTIPLLSWRIEHVREVAQGLLTACDGQFAHLVRSAAGSAAALVRLVSELFPSFRDFASYAGLVVPFSKRAQLLCTDLAGAFQGRDLGSFHDLDALTAFADYKLPQVLRFYGALRYAEPLARRIDAREEIPAGSPEEVEIRAATVCAVDELVARLHAQGQVAAAWQVDWALWQLGQSLPPDAPPYHRTRTRFY